MIYVPVVGISYISPKILVTSILFALFLDVVVGWSARDNSETDDYVFSVHEQQRGPPLDVKVRAAMAPTQKTDVIVGGAGWSGISLSESLHRAKVGFLILEASDRLGGRIHNRMFGKGREKYSIELRAQWINGIDFNPVWAMAEKVGLQGTLQNFTFQFYDEEGKQDFDEELFEEGSACSRVDETSFIADELSINCLQLGAGDNVTDQDFCNMIRNPFIPSDDDDISEEENWFAATGFSPETDPNPPNARACQAFCKSFCSLLDVISFELHAVSPVSHSTHTLDEDLEYGIDMPVISANNSFPLTTGK